MHLSQIFERTHPIGVIKYLLAFIVVIPVFVVFLNNWINLHDIATLCA